MRRVPRRISCGPLSRAVLFTISLCWAADAPAQTVTSGGAAANYLPEECRKRPSFEVYGHQFNYDVISGWAVVEEDIIIGRAEQAGEFTDSKFYAETILPLTRGVPDKTWDRGIVTYDDSGLPPTRRPSFQTAIREFERQTRGRIQFFPKRDIDKDYVRVQYVPTLCRATVGKRSSVNFIQIGDGCSVGDIMHELGHVIGLHHEHNRPDRDKHVRVNWNNIEPKEYGAFCPIWEDQGQALGAYDFKSIMHYPWWAFGRKKWEHGKRVWPVTIQSVDVHGKVPAKVKPLLSNDDLAAIASLYPRQPTPLTAVSDKDWCKSNPNDEGPRCYKHWPLKKWYRHSPPSHFDSVSKIADSLKICDGDIWFLPRNRRLASRFCPKAIPPNYPIWAPRYPAPAKRCRYYRHGEVPNC